MVGGGGGGGAEPPHFFKDTTSNSYYNCAGRCLKNAIREPQKQLKFPKFSGKAHQNLVASYIHMYASESMSNDSLKIAVRRPQKHSQSV